MVARPGHESRLRPGPGPRRAGRSKGCRAASVCRGAAPATGWRLRSKISMYRESGSSFSLSLFSFICCFITSFSKNCLTSTEIQPTKVFLSKVHHPRPSFRIVPGFVSAPSGQLHNSLIAPSTCLPIMRHPFASALLFANTERCWPKRRHVLYRPDGAGSDSGRVKCSGKARRPSSSDDSEVPAFKVCVA